MKKKEITCAIIWLLLGLGLFVLTTLKTLDEFWSGMGAALVAVGFYLLLPFSLEIRQALVILAFSPLTSTAPFYTSELKEDVGLASAVNSASIVISIIVVVTLLVVML